MDINELRNKKSSFWILQFSGWLGLYFIYLFLYYRNYLSDFRTIIAILLTYIIGFFCSLLLRYYYKRVHYKNHTIGSLAFIVVISSVLVAFLWYSLDVILSIPLYDPGWSFNDMTLQHSLSTTYSHAFVLGTWSSLYFVIKLWAEWNIQKERTEKADELAQTAQLQMLRYQLNPHFLFNALNSIRALVDENQKHAKEMITELSEFLRYSLISKNYSNVPLKEELEAIRHYFRIEKKRYEEKLQIDYQINPLAEEYPVLSFLIHPIVENAIKYGMQTSEIPLKIILKADVKDNTLVLEICNSGSWIESDASKDDSRQGTGTGLNNIRQRLENAFPGRHSFSMQKEENSVCVKIEINRTIV